MLDEMPKVLNDSDMIKWGWKDPLDKFRDGLMTLREALVYRSGENTQFVQTQFINLA